ncbi:MAG: hypothetical protein Q4B84_01275 [Clostridia bacterium]|nr:hypothetical protein [Clostridia bacterium]
MQIFLLLIIFILICTVIYQGKEIKDLERKTLEAFRVVCNKWIIENMEEESRKMDIEEKTRQ